MKISFTRAVILVATLATMQMGCATHKEDTDAATANARAALENLYRQDPAAAQLGARAKGVLVFPNVLKAGLVFGGHGGNGVLFVNGRAEGYYNTSAVSAGLQAGIQRYGYALFLMNQAAIDRLHNTGGWEIGTDPNVVVLDSGAAAALNTTTAQNNVYAVIFDQRGLMAGVTLQGAKITQVTPIASNY